MKPVADAQAEQSFVGKRLTQLDSLRGLAAVSVVLNHCLNIPSPLGNTLFGHLLQSSPLALIRAGHPAVILFFILSGFVLALPFFKGPVPYRAFVVKRFFRIYLPYYATICLSILMVCILKPNGIQALGPWFNSSWTTPLTPNLIINHALLIGSFNSYTLDGAIWSLVHEMRISLIFPALMYVVLRWDWKRCLLLGFLFSLAAAVLYAVQYFVLHIKTDYAQTVHYIGFFITGGLLAKHRASVTDWCAGVSRYAKAGMLAGATIAYTFGFWCPALKIPGYWLFVDWIICIGASLFIVLALASRTISGLLTFRPVRFIGETSYSIYLLHSVILFSLVYPLYGKVAMHLIWIMTLSGTMVLSAFWYFLFERPSIRIGRILADKLAARSPGTLRSPSTATGGTPACD